MRLLTEHRRAPAAAARRAALWWPAWIVGLLSAVLLGCGERGSADPRQAPAQSAAELDAVRADLLSPDVVVRRRAAERLIGGPPAAQALTAPLAQALSDPDRWVRESAGKALRDLGPLAGPAVPDLARALEDSDDYVRWRAAEALGRVGVAAQAALPRLDALAAERHETEVVRASSAVAAERIRAALKGPPPAAAR